MRQGGGKVNYGAAKFAKRLFYLRLVVLVLIGYGFEAILMCGKGADEAL